MIAQSIGESRNKVSSWRMPNGQLMEAILEMNDGLGTK
jgi:hypothetical protein